MKAMILAAGYGTRLRPVTYTLPKPIVPLAGRPLIGWAIEALLNAGIHDFIVNLHHLPELIERYLRDRYASRARFQFSFEPEILGTGGGVRKVRTLLENDPEFFLVNGDTVQFPPYGALRASRRGALAALTLRHPPQGDRFTPVYFDDGAIAGFGKGTGEALMFSGTHLISNRIFDYLPDIDFSGIVDEVYQPLIDSGRERIVGVVDDNRFWFDIGTLQRYMTASQTLLDAMVRGALALPNDTCITADSLIHDTAKVTGTMIRSIAGERSVIEGTLTDTVVWDDCRIGRSAKLEGCIVAHGVEIANVDLRNVLVCRDDPAIPRDGEHRFENGLVLRDI